MEVENIMKFLLNKKRLLGLGGFEGQSESEILEFAENNGYVLVETPDDLEYLLAKEDFIDSVFNMDLYNLRNNKDLAKQELQEIQVWFEENDWKPNKIVRKEWTEDDPRWIQYLSDAEQKRIRQDKLNLLLAS
jgi:hypothetical protein